MQDKLFAVRGEATHVEFRGAAEGVVFPTIDFVVAPSAEVAVDRAFKAMDEREDAWIAEANALLKKKVHIRTMRPSKPVFRESWRATEVEVPGYTIVLEKESLIRVTKLFFARILNREAATG